MGGVRLFKAMAPSHSGKLFSGLVLFLVASAAYLYTFPQPNVFYAVIVLLHAVVGVVATALLLLYLFRVLRQGGYLLRAGWVVLTAGALVGCWLIYTGTSRPEWNWLYLHILLSLAGVAIWWAVRSQPSLRTSIERTVAALLIVAAVGAGSWYVRNTRWQNRAKIENPTMPPSDMNAEGDGPNGPFFPSSAQVYGGQKIPSKFFMESDSCKRCHEDVYNQWFSSVHHFSSFNNQWYRKSIEYMQDTIGTKPSKWCGGCHDPAVLYAGLMDTPIKQIVHTPPAQAGLGCMMCHSIAAVKSTMGQGDFYLEYPELHELAASKNPVVKYMHDFLVKLNPEPHRRAFLKPFMRTQTAEFCSSCHKVHLDVPVNHYRWLRGFNEYDNWQASGVSGQGARSFYYPPNPMMCADCHMPLVPSKDEGNINGYVHSHRFPGANTAVPIANEDAVQLEASRKFLQDGQLSVDIFAISPISKEEAAKKASEYPKQELSTTFAIGEESETSSAKGPAGRARPITAPLGRVDAAVRRGDDVLVDVVVRTRKVGHFFPGGTVDAFDVWLELQAVDDKGQTIFWSGKVADSGKGPVEPGAHFYRSLQIDGHGNVINKRNAWATRSVVYVHLIPPGAADTVHYRLHVPENCGDKITLRAKLNYRKFSWYNTQFSFAGVEERSMQSTFGSIRRVTPDFDDRMFGFNGDTSNVSGDIKAIPDLPVTVLAEDTKTLRVLPKNSRAPQPATVTTKEDWTRWNDYGIGLFLQGDLKAAAAAFEKITEADAQNPDGWTNIGRVLLQEGDTTGARKVLEKSLAINAKLARTNFFYAKVLREEGDYDGAIGHLKTVLEQFPRDRVVHSELGRVLFLEKHYADAVAEFEKTLSIDPEDLQAHYNLMLCYNGLGNERKAEEHKARYLRFKADESAQAITGPYRQAHPDDNNERQPVHEHYSVVLTGAPRKKSPAPKAAIKVSTSEDTKAGVGN